MSFGFGIGDFIAVLQLINQIRKDYSDAPDQFAALSDEVKNLSTTIKCIDESQLLNDEQKKAFKGLIKSCDDVRVKMKNTLEKYVELELEPGQKDVGNRIKRVWKRLNWDLAEVQDLRNRVIVTTNMVNTFQTSITHQVTQAAKSGVDLLNERQMTEECRREKLDILDWITVDDTSVKTQSDIIQRRQEGTGQWLLDSCEFRVWLMTKGHVLFCPGIPGAGKTILTSVVVDELTTRLKDDSSIGIAYVYCNYRRHSEQNLKQLLSSLLQQLLRKLPYVPDSVKKLYDECRELRAPMLSEIKTLLHSVGALYSRVYILIDALDECQVSDNCRSEFLTEIFALQGSCAANVFATSRFIPEITNRFESRARLEIRSRDEDIEKYLESKISRSDLSLLEKCREEIKTEIAQKVDGMFLLAQLYFDVIRTKKTVKKIKAALNSFTAGQNAYDCAYDEAMERIQSLDNDSKELAMQVLSWIICAESQLKVNELQTALAIEEGESELDEENKPQVDDMISVCAGLVTVDEQSNVVRLVHYTTQEYFDRTRQQWFPEADRDISMKCLSYLSFSTFGSGACNDKSDWDNRTACNPFFLYAARNWGYHVRRCSGLVHHVVAFFERDNNMQAAAQTLLDPEFRLFFRCYTYQPEVSGLHLAAYFGQLDVIRSLLKTDKGERLFDGFGFTPLMYAAVKGHEAAVTLILECKLQYIHSYGVGEGLEEHFTPLSHAAAAGHEGVVKIFLALEDIDINLKNEYGKTALACAVSSGHEAIVKLLLADKRIDADPKQDDGWTPLLIAANSGREDLVNLFLARKDVDVDPRDDDGKTPLSTAALQGHESVVKLLLSEKDVNPDSRNNKSRTPLSYASEKGNDGIVRLLLETGTVDVNSRCNRGWTPLAYASYKGHLAVFETFLAFGGVDLDSKNNKGNTPLILATEQGHNTIAETLLKHPNVDPGHQNNDGQSALWWAKDVGIVKLLLDIPSINPNAQDRHGYSALFGAVIRRWCSSGVAELLLADDRVDPNIKDNKGRTPFYFAADKEDTDIAKIFLSTTKATAQTRDDDGRTPLSWAASGGSPKITRLLLEDYNADASSIDAKGRSVLWYAVTESTKVVELLLRQPGIAVNAADDTYRWTPLIRVSRFSRFLRNLPAFMSPRFSRSDCSRVVEALLAVGGINVNFKDRYLRTALSWAARKGQYPIVELLLAAKGIETDLPDIDGRTPLSLAAQGRNGNQARRMKKSRYYKQHSDEWYACVVKLLLSEGRANPNLKDTTGRSPLSWAAQGGNEEIIRILLDAMDKNDIDQKDNSGKTPMAYAVNYGYEKVVKMLLDRGAVEPSKYSVFNCDDQSIDSWKSELEKNIFRFENWQNDKFDIEFIFFRS